MTILLHCRLKPHENELEITDWPRFVVQRLRLFGHLASLWTKPSKFHVDMICHGHLIKMMTHGHNLRKRQDSPLPSLLAPEHDAAPRDSHVRVLIIVPVPHP